MVSLPIDSDGLRNGRNGRKGIIGIAGVILLLVILISTHAWGHLKIILQPIDESVCPLHSIQRPASFDHDNSTALLLLFDEEFRNQSAIKLSGAVQVDTQIFDNQPDVADAPEVWAKFKKFHRYLEKTFPTVYEHLQVEKVNTYGLVFYWKGSDPGLKPVMLTAHQDVVPVQKDTLKDWTYPPFEGHYDGTYLYGRGASDCKNVLIAIMESFEVLLKEKFVPKRGIVAAFGFDEESSGVIGASNIARHLEHKFGKNSIYAVIDEGSALTHNHDSNEVIAIASTGEKGYVDIKVEYTTVGGHSSVPPDHTSIGIVSDLASLIEKDPYQPLLTTRNPFLNSLQCTAVHNSQGLSRTLRRSILRAGFDKLANKKVVKFLESNPLTKYLIQTSQAIDIVRGGEKANALPEFVELLVNHRVAVESHPDVVKQHFVERVVEVAKKHNVAVEAFGQQVRSSDNPGMFKISVSGHDLVPSPVTPANDTVWKYLAGVTRHVFEELVVPNVTKPIVLTPGIMTGNTDTKYYWNLTRNIFRYSPAITIDPIKESHIHSVDEKIKFSSHLELLTFFYEYIQTIDSPDADNS